MCKIQDNASEGYHNAEVRIMYGASVGQVGRKYIISIKSELRASDIMVKFKNHLSMPTHSTKHIMNIFCKPYTRNSKHGQLALRATASNPADIISRGMSPGEITQQHVGGVDPSGCHTPKRSCQISLFEIYKQCQTEEKYPCI